MKKRRGGSSHAVAGSAAAAGDGDARTLADAQGNGGGSGRAMDTGRGGGGHAQRTAHRKIINIADGSQHIAANAVHRSADADAHPGGSSVAEAKGSAHACTDCGGGDGGGIAGRHLEKRRPEAGVTNSQEGGTHGGADAVANAGTREAHAHIGPLACREGNRHRHDACGDRGTVRGLDAETTDGADASGAHVGPGAGGGLGGRAGQTHGTVAVKE